MGRGYKLEPKGEMHRVRSERVPNVKLLLSSPHKVRMHYSSSTWICDNCKVLPIKEALPSLSVQSFCWNLIIQAQLIKSLAMWLTLIPSGLLIPRSWANITRLKAPVL